MSRELLRGEGEHVQRLSPLSVPSAPAERTAEQALAFPSVQLFVERVTACLDGFLLTDPAAPVVADIYRRLDGIALAIELAAARIDAFGVAGLAAHLYDRLDLLADGRRSALPRHRTMSAALDWSYDLPPVGERSTLQQPAVSP